MYRIKEIETNIRYDASYFTLQDVKKEIAKYQAADARQNRVITYCILDEGNNILEVIKCKG